MKSSNVTKDREKYIGGSDIPILMGISPFKTRWQLLKEKSEPKSNIASVEYTNKQIEYGNEMEEKIREYINETMDCNFVPATKIVDDLRGNCDGIYVDTILEIKTTSIIHKNVDEYKSYLVQLLFYMKLFNKENGILAVYERPEDYSTKFKHKRLHIYRVNIAEYEDLLTEIIRQISRFREDLATLKGNPFLTEEELQPTEITEIVDRVLVLEEQLKTLKVIEKQINDFKTQLKEAMQKSGVKSYVTNGGVRITLVPDGEPSVEYKFDEKAFMVSHPKIYNKYLKPKEKKGRAGYVRITIPD